MKHINLFQIKLSHIQIFLAAAEYGSFTLAADKLYLTQPLVSKTITGIEKELGICLFVRTHGKLQITPAGRALQQEWGSIMNFFEHSLENAHTIQEGREKRLRIGMGELGADSQEQIQVIKNLREKRPDLVVNMECSSMENLWKKLQRDELDAILISGHLLPEVKRLGFQWKIFMESTLSVFVPKGSAVYNREKVEFKDLKTEKFVVFSPDNDGSYMRLLQKLAEDAGFVPQIACYVPSELSFKVNLALGNGIVLADSNTDLETEEVKKFNLEGYSNNEIIVWNKNNTNKGLQEFLDLF